MTGRNEEVAPHPTDVILVTDKKIGEVLATSIRNVKPKAEVIIVETPEKVAALNPEISPGTLLIGYGTGIIIQGTVLKRFSRPAINFHAASPEYPGRDPHHWAVYEGASEYGVTAHEMTERVDEGPIVAVQRFPIPYGIKPEELVCLANEYLYKLFCNLLPQLIDGTYELSREVWAGVKRSRQDFLDMCSLNPWIGSKEFARRFNAFDGGRYDNLTLDLHGQQFRIEKTSATSSKAKEVAVDWNDFTLVSYRENLRLAKKSYLFASFGETVDAPHVLWRHDIDFSVHQAAILAKIEEEEACKATYFVSLHSSFYNLFEVEIVSLVREIIACGHDLGLHFDAAAYPSETWTYEALVKWAGFEQSVLEQFFGVEVKSISFHNPDISNMLDLDCDSIGGMVNVYGKTIKTEYTYVSDSNGYWRFEPIPKILTEATSPKLHVLTHPAWWVDEPMRPYKRIERCASGRASNVLREYVEGLNKHGRKNL